MCFYLGTGAINSIPFKVGDIGTFEAVKLKNNGNDIWVCERMVMTLGKTDYTWFPRSALGGNGPSTFSQSPFDLCGSCTLN